MTRLLFSTMLIATLAFPLIGCKSSKTEKKQLVKSEISYYRKDELQTKTTSIYSNSKLKSKSVYKRTSNIGNKQKYKYQSFHNISNNNPIYMEYKYDSLENLISLIIKDKNADVISTLLCNNNGDTLSYTIGDRKTEYKYSNDSIIINSDFPANRHNGRITTLKRYTSNDTLKIKTIDNYDNNTQQRFIRRKNKNGNWNYNIKIKDGIQDTISFSEKVNGKFYRSKRHSGKTIDLLYGKDSILLKRSSNGITDFNTLFNPDSTIREINKFMITPIKYGMVNWFVNGTNKQPYSIKNQKVEFKYYKNKKIKSALLTIYNLHNEDVLEKWKITYNPSNTALKFYNNSGKNNEFVYSHSLQIDTGSNTKRYYSFNSKGDSQTKTIFKSGKKHRSIVDIKHKSTDYYKYSKLEVSDSIKTIVYKYPSYEDSIIKIKLKKKWILLHQTKKDKLNNIIEITNKYFGDYREKDKPYLRPKEYIKIENSDTILKTCYSYLLDDLCIVKEYHYRKNNVHYCNHSTYKNSKLTSFNGKSDGSKKITSTINNREFTVYLNLPFGLYQTTFLNGDSLKPEFETFTSRAGKIDTIYKAQYSENEVIAYELFYEKHGYKKNDNYNFKRLKSKSKTERYYNENGSLIKEVKYKLGKKQLNYSISTTRIYTRNDFDQIKKVIVTGLGKGNSKSEIINTYK